MSDRDLCVALFSGWYECNAPGEKGLSFFKLGGVHWFPRNMSLSGKGLVGRIPLQPFYSGKHLNYGQGFKIECDPCFGQGRIFSALAK